MHSLMRTFFLIVFIGNTLAVGAGIFVGCSTAFTPSLVGRLIVEAGCGVWFFILCVEGRGWWLFPRKLNDFDNTLLVNNYGRQKEVFLKSVEKTYGADVRHRVTELMKDCPGQMNVGRLLYSAVLSQNQSQAVRL